jgi:hypothetical protein
MSRIPFPDDAYLAKLGQVAYAVGYVEGYLLGDLVRIPGLPSELSFDNLSYLTTGQIADKVDQYNSSALDPTVHSFLTTCAKWLRVLAPLRNDILHARPATVDDSQRLFRWVRKKDGSVYAFLIHEATLDSFLTRVDEAVSEIEAVRLPF